MQPASKSHFAALDALRGLAALSVVFFHISWQSVFEPLRYVRNGYLMVDVFFVLSGFVIFYSYFEKLARTRAVGDFMWLRFWRLYPIHLLFLLVLLGIEILKKIAEMRLGMVANHPAFSENNLVAFVENLLLIHALGIGKAATFNVPSWSISVEFYLYLIFAVVVCVLRGRRATLCASAVLCLVGLGAMAALGRPAFGSTYDFGMLRGLAGFFAGVLTYAAYAKLSTNAVVAGNHERIGAAAVAALIAIVAFLSLKTVGYSDLAIFPASAVLILLVALAGRAVATGFLFSRAAMFLGNISYSLYMCHFAIFWFVKTALRVHYHVTDKTFPDGSVVLMVTRNIGTAAALAAVAAAVILSSFTYRWIEMPFRDWSKRKLSKWSSHRERALTLT